MKEALIDTDIISFYFKGDESVAKKIIEYSKEYGLLNLSIITQFEVLGGLEYKKAHRQKELFTEFVNGGLPAVRRLGAWSGSWC